MSVRKQKVYFSIAYFLIYVAQGAGYCSLVDFYIRVGYSPAQRGYLMAIGAIAGIIMQTIVGYLCDKHRTVKKYIFLTCILFAAGAALTYYFDQPNFGLHLLFALLLIGAFRTLMGISDSWVYESGDELRDSFGAIRAFGSIGWSVGSTLVAWVVKQFGFRLVGVAVLLFIVATIAVESLIPDAEKHSQKKVTPEEIRILFRNRPYLLMIATLFFIFMVQAALDITIIDKLYVLNADEYAVSTYWSVTALSELPLFFLGKTIKNRFSAVTLLVFSNLIYGLRFFLYGYTQSITVIMLISLLQALSFPIIQIVSKDLVDRHVPEHLKSSGQQIGMAIHTTFSSFLTPLVAGLVEEAVGVDYALYMFAAMTLLACLLIYWYVQVVKKEEETAQ